MFRALRDHARRLFAVDESPRMRNGAVAKGSLRVVDHLVGFVLGTVTIAILLATSDIGFTRDEGFYFQAAKKYLGWFEELETNVEEGDSDPSFTQENIDKHWSINPEHPVLLKASFALSYRSLAKEREWLPPSTAMRFPTMLFVGVLIWLMYVFMAEAFTRVGGLFAVVALMAMPRWFFHAHMACFDAAMATMWFAVMYAYWKSLRSRAWVWLAALIWGVSLGTKLNAFFIPGVLLMHWALNGWADFRLRREDNGGRLKTLMLSIPRVPSAFFTMIVVGPVIFYLMWPRHWFDTFARIFWYLERHLGHEHYAVWYNGELLAQPPFPGEFPYVMTLLTVPLITLLAFAVGVVALTVHGRWEPRFRFVKARLREMIGGPKAVRDYVWDSRGTVLLMVLGTWIPYLIISRPDTPIFGGVKHWSTAMPFFACFAGIGFTWAFDRLAIALREVPQLRLEVFSRPIARVALALAAMPIILWPAVRETARIHPHGTAYYNEAAGGPRGAADMGMHRQFWGYAARDALEWINENASENSRVHFQNTIHMAVEMYREDGLLRSDIREAWTPESAEFLLHHHQEAFNYQLFTLWNTYRTASPVHVVSVDGVPVLSVYRNPDYKR